MQHRQLRDEVKRLRDEVGQRKGTVGPAGRERTPWRELRALVARIADSETSVLITGESGTGKEVVARAIHEQGRRKGGPLRGGQLRRDARGPAGERAVRPRQGRLHRRAAGAHRPVRAGAGRHAVPRRDRRAAARPAAQAAARAAGAEGAPGGRRTRRSPSTCASSPPPTATWRRRSRRSASARTSTSASTSSTCTCRRCACAATTCCCWRSTSCGTSPRRAASRWWGSPPAAAEKLLAYAWPGNVRELQN